MDSLVAGIGALNWNLTANSLDGLMADQMYGSMEASTTPSLMAERLVALIALLEDMIMLD